MDDAKVELVAVLRETLAFIEMIEAREDTHYLIGGKISEQITALEASPNSRTEAITDEMRGAGKSALLTMLRAPAHNGEPFDYELTVERIYTAMQDARPIGRP